MPKSTPTQNNGVVKSAAANSLPPHQRDQVFPEQHLVLPQAEFSFRRIGEQQPAVVLLHGIGSGAGSWWACAQQLAEHAQVIAWNAPGYAGSTPLKQARPMATDYARHLHTLVQALNLSPFVLVGHSLGALIAAAYSSLFASNLKGLLLFSPAIGYGAADKLARSQEVRQGRLNNLKNLGIQGMAEALPKRLVHGTVPEHHDEVVYNASRITPKGYRQAVELLCQDDINRYQVLSQTRVYCGEYDIVTTPEQCAAYAQHQNLPFQLVKNAGHACYVEQPQQVAEFISERLK